MPRPVRLAGELHLLKGFRSEILANRRNLLVYLPPGYHATSQRFPVLYLHDGQNCFDPATSFAGTAWEADEAADRLIGQDRIEPVILVAIYNTGVQRLDEYGPTPSRSASWGGQHLTSTGSGRAYARFVIREVKAYIDRHYRTRPEREFTGLAGSSMGGLITSYMGLVWHPEVFGRLGIFSPSVWWDEKVLLRDVAQIPRRPETRVWLDTGTQEWHWKDIRLLRTGLTRKGWHRGRTLRYHEARGGQHTEGAWAKRIGPALEWLFPPEHG